MLIFLFIIAVNILIYFFNSDIARGLNLFDNPDKFRKLHKTKVPLTGGIIIILNSCSALIITLIDQLYFDKLIIFKNNIDLIILLVSILTFFFIGFFDDKYSVSANKRFLFILIILFPIIYFSESMMINKIYFSFTDYSLTLPNFISIFWI